MTTRKLIAVLLSILLLIPVSLMAEAEVTPAMSSVDWTFENGGTGWKVRFPYDAEAGKVVDEIKYINRAYSEKAENVHDGEKSLRLANDGKDGYTAAGVYTSLSRSLIKQNKSLTLEGLGCAYPLHGDIFWGMLLSLWSSLIMKALIRTKALSKAEVTTDDFVTASFQTIA